MTSNLTSVLSCAVFGHNLRRTKSAREDTYMCSSCHNIIHMDDFGTIEEIPSQNKEVHQTLRQLFLLNRLKRRIVNTI